MSNRPNPLFANLDKKEAEIIKGDEVKSESLETTIGTPSTKEKLQQVEEPVGGKEKTTETSVDVSGDEKEGEDDNIDKRTKDNKPKKGRKKKSYGFSLDIEMMNELQRYCDDRLINHSVMVQKIIEDFLVEVKRQEEEK